MGNPHASGPRDRSREVPALASLTHALWALTRGWKRKLELPGKLELGNKREKVTKNVAAAPWCCGREAVAGRWEGSLRPDPVARGRWQRLGLSLPPPRARYSLAPERGVGQGWEDSSAADCLQKVLQAQPGAVSSVCAVHASRWAGGPRCKPQVLHLWHGAISGLSTGCAQEGRGQGASGSLLACADGPGEVGRAPHWGRSLVKSGLGRALFRNTSACTGVSSRNPWKWVPRFSSLNLAQKQAGSSGP